MLAGGGAAIRVGGDRGLTTMTDISRIRNFCIVAHINHGKSTLADRILEHTGLVTPREMREQVLDAMDLERERGITIKASAVRIPYRAQDGNDYVLNLIDTPGHVDFSYEVSRSLAACEGALLVVDAAQGVEAQTIANALLAVGHDLHIIPVINKIDLRSASIERTRDELEEMVGISADDAVLTSAKEGAGTIEVLEAVVQRIPPPAGDAEGPLRALIFDSHFDPYRGVIAYLRVREGRLRPGMRIRFMATGGDFEVADVGVFRMRMESTDELVAGEVGYVAAGVKTIGDARVGDTITDAQRPAPQPLAGYREAKPMVFCGIYPTEGTDYHLLRDALEKLQLNDPALHFEPESSAALGFGFRCGFLGLLHMEIVQERLEREYELELIATSPTVVYRVTTTDGQVSEIENPSAMPETQRIAQTEEPYILATIMAPGDYVGPCLELCQERHGIQKSIDYSQTGRVIITYELPLSGMLFDFFDQLKSRSRGLASFDYEVIGYRPADLARMNILINGQIVDALSFITHRERAYRRGKALVQRLRKLLSRQMFEVRIQAALDGRIIASETIKPLRKNVVAKCYGGDVTRKRKLLEKQKAGKKRMKQVGNVNIPQEAFMSVLKIEE